MPSPALFPDLDALNADLSPTDTRINELILACATPVVSRRDPGSLEEIDLPRLLAVARGHGVIPLLHRYLSGPLAELLPPQFRDSLRHHSYAVSRRNLELTGELIRVHRRLEREGVRALPYKGPMLALQAYGDLAARQFGDLDLLIRPEDLDRAIGALEGAGFTHYPQVTPAQYRAYRRSECEVWMANADESVNVELHWTVRERLYAFPLDLEGIFARSRPVRVAGAQLPGVGVEDQLLILAIHGIKHAWYQLKWVRDVAGLLATQPDLDWDAVFREARRLHAERLVLLAVLLPHLLLSVPLPGDVLARADPAARRLAVQVARLLLRSLGREPAPRTCYSVYLRARPRWQQRLRFLGELLFTPTLAEWESLRLPDAAFPLYHLYRPFRLVFRPNAAAESVPGA